MQSHRFCKEFEKIPESSCGDYTTCEGRFLKVKSISFNRSLYYNLKNNLENKRNKFTFDET